MQGIIKTGGSVKLIDLGTATSFNIQTLAPNVDYTKLTIDNFFISTISSESGSRGTGTVYPDRSGVNINMSITKTYDVTTGVLECHYNGTACYKDSNGTWGTITKQASVHCYLIVNPKIA